MRRPSNTKITSSLMKTADGVTMFPGMSVYFVSSEKLSDCEVSKEKVGSVGIGTWSIYNGGGWGLPALIRPQGGRPVFSTRALAVQWVIIELYNSLINIQKDSKYQLLEKLHVKSLKSAVGKSADEIVDKFQATEPTKITQQDTKMFKNRFEVGQKILCTDGAGAKRITNGKEYVVINNDYDNHGSGMDMLDVINDDGNKERYFVYRFSAATAENVATAEKIAAKQPKRVVAKVTNSYLTRGQSYEVVGYYIPAAESYKVKLDDKTGYALSFRSDCFESDISLSDVTNVDGATGTKENEMKKETAVKVASVVGKFAAGWGFRALNYWVFEPAAGIGRPIMKSVRYATFLGGLAAVGYGYYHPQEVKDALVSCLPTVSIEAPTILSGK